MTVAQEIRVADVTIPHGTLPSAPVTIDVSFPERIVIEVRWRVPPGPSGQMGWRLSSDGVPVIPVVPGTWIIADGHSDDWPLSGYLDSGNWQVTGYNTGVYDHAVHLTFLLNQVGSGAPIPVVAAAAWSPAGLVAGSVDMSSIGA